MTNIFRAYFCLPVLKENNKYTQKNKHDHVIKRNHMKQQKNGVCFLLPLESLFCSK